MSADTYQAVYDAVRSRISNGDIGYAVENVLRNANISHYADLAGRAVQEAVSYYMAPSAIYRPALSVDGDQWCALYGKDLASGVAGFGDTPAQAMAAFDQAWVEQRTPKAIHAGGAS